MSTLIATGLGRLGRDPESRDTDYGAVVSVSLAFDHGYGERKTTTWIRVSAWGKLGELLMRLQKGNRVQVSGEFYTSTWTDKDNVDRTDLEIKASAITVIDWPETDTRQAEKPAGRARGGSDDLAKPAPKPAKPPRAGKKEQPFDDGLPF